LTWLLQGFPPRSRSRLRRFTLDMLSVLDERNAMTATSKARAGRPGQRGGSAKHAPVSRDKMVIFYLTEQDASQLREIAHRGRFRSTSHLLTAIVEPVLLGGFSLAAFIRSAKRVQGVLQARGVKFTADWSDLVELFQPQVPPAIPEEPISIDQLREDFERVLEAIADEQNKQQPNQHKTK